MKETFFDSVIKQPAGQPFFAKVKHQPITPPDAEQMRLTETTAQITEDADSTPSIILTDPRLNPTSFADFFPFNIKPGDNILISLPQREIQSDTGNGSVAFCWGG